MTSATALDRLRPGLLLWHYYDSTLKAELFSTAIESDSGWFLVDPIPLTVEARDELAFGRHLAGIVVTNTNHQRDSAQLGRRFSLPVFAHPHASASLEGRYVQPIKGGDYVAPDLCAIAIDGAAAGEIALRHERDGGTIIVGDALINFEPHGFGFLPTKYCSNAKQMRRSLRQLLDFEFERMLFAHGTPLMKSARKQLEELLSSGS